jgi:hypothetical protein
MTRASEPSSPHGSPPEPDGCRHGRGALGARAWLTAVLLTCLLPRVTEASDLTDQHIVVLIICQSGSCYLGENQQIAAILGDADANVTEYVLYADTLQSGGGTVTLSAFADDLASADQVWVADHSSQWDTYGHMMDAYNHVIGWYLGRALPHIILDARIMGSLWQGGQAGTLFTLSRPDEGLVTRYATALAEVGGGLVLMTDHDAFHAGINEINKGIGISAFYGYWHQEPYLALVSDHLLWRDHPEATYAHASLQDSDNYIVSWFPHCATEPCHFLVADSSPGAVPTGLQENGRILVPVAFNGGDAPFPSVSTTLQDADPLVAHITPAGPELLVFDESAELEGGFAGGVPGHTLRWLAGEDVVGLTEAVVIDLPHGETVTVTLEVTDGDGRKARAFITLQSGFCEEDATCPAGRTCVDGVCCDTECAGQCEACDVNGSAGTCIAITGTPRHGRTPCASDGSACGGTCDGVVGEACAYPTVPCREPTCDDAIATLPADCDGLGACPEAQTVACEPFLCGATSCLEVCSSDDDCASDHLCATEVCLPKLDDGAECSGDPECRSGHCVDGVCCDGVCDGPCEACSEPGEEGRCTPVTGDPRSGRPACDGVGACRGVCDGTDGSACAYPGDETECDAAACASGTAVAASVCDGAGSCAPGATVSCGAYECGGDGCLETCASEADCAPEHACRDSQCVPVDDGPTSGSSCGGCAGASAAPPSLALLLILGWAAGRMGAATRRRTPPISRRPCG